MARTLRTITVGELLDALDGHDRDMLVIFTADYGDRGNTEQALPITGDVEEVEVTESAYSHSGFAIGEPDEDDDARDSTPYLVIR